MNSDVITPPFNWWKVFSCNWELDSLASFLQLSTDYVTATGNYDFFGKYSWTKAVKQILETAEQMTIDSYDDNGVWKHTNYTYCAPYGGTPINDCNGSPHKGNIGLIRSFMRPSDDACIYQYLIPSNMMFSVALNSSAEIMAKLPDKMELANEMKKMATAIRKGIEKYGVVRDPEYGEIYAYEVDGYGSANLMDDANIPSLLSAPFLGYLPRSDKIYQNTRKKVLSRDNPYFSWGPIISGVGSPHTKPGKTWPMACIMAILTSDSDEEIITNLRELVSSTDHYGLMHESIDSRNANMWSRQW
jgi:meiotically up-regulated gene 157 (Mug157) protein